MSRKGRFKADLAIIGQGSVTKCISAPDAEWSALDEAALKVQMSRSQFVRQAVKRFIAFVADPKQEAP